MIDDISEMILEYTHDFILRGTSDINIKRYLFMIPIIDLIEEFEVGRIKIKCEYEDYPWRTCNSLERICFEVKNSVPKFTGGNENNVIEIGEDYLKFYKELKKIPWVAMRLALDGYSFSDIYFEIRSSIENVLKRVRPRVKLILGNCKYTIELFKEH